MRRRKKQLADEVVIPSEVLRVRMERHVDDALDRSAGRALPEGERVASRLEHGVRSIEKGLGAAAGISAPAMRPVASRRVAMAV